ncbi:uncharacterized protein E0L32_001112 [Thyridium curvatum]|uniref:Cytochrome P450 n=1 Tax=Thyridium curvatum TaxID=1093900 RepID=A0A507AXX3_9PEZI|nr:uncharacterized protein E0L32_001112 [Thyridium curvatum]TPX11294.1 hypothetical protein E0L32_001112 [Thyridium curvatum]
MELTIVQFTVLVVYTVVSSALFLGYMTASSSHLTATPEAFRKEGCLIPRLIIFGLIPCLLWPVVVVIFILSILVYGAGAAILFFLRLSALQLRYGVEMCCGFESERADVDLETGLGGDHSAAEPSVAAEDTELENIEIAEHQVETAPSPPMQMRLPEQPASTDTEDESEGTSSIYMKGFDATWQEFRASAQTIAVPIQHAMAVIWDFADPRAGILVLTACLLYRLGRMLFSRLLGVPGPVVRLGPNRYSVASCDGLRAVYGPAAAKTFPKSPSYYPASPPDREKWTLFADDDIQRHARNRRLFQSTYSMTSLVTYETYVDECTDLFSLRLSELAAANVPVGMGFWFQCFAFDVIGLITYSSRLGFLDQGEDIGSVIKTIDDEMVYFSLVGVYSYLHKLIFPIRNWLAGTKGTGRTYLMKFTKDRVAEHVVAPKSVTIEDAEARKVPLDFLSKFLNMNASDSEFTMYHVLAGCASNIVAGSDTTATSLSGILYHLLKNPGTLEKLRQEVSSVAAEVPENRPITWNTAQAMPYLQAVIKEALRLHTAVSLPMERVVAPGGTTIEGYHFPKGTYVGINNWVYHRSKSIFGEDADQFKPERWLTQDPNHLIQMHRNLISFGAGARTCIGRHIASLQISKLVPTLVRDFDFELSEEIAGPDQEWKTKNYFFLKPTNFRVRVTQRR